MQRYKFFLYCTAFVWHQQRLHWILNASHDTLCSTQFRIHCYSFDDTKISFCMRSSSSSQSQFKRFGIKAIYDTTRTTYTNIRQKYRFDQYQITRGQQKCHTIGVERHMKTEWDTKRAREREKERNKEMTRENGQLRTMKIYWMESNGKTWNECVMSFDYHRSYVTPASMCSMYRTPGEKREEEEKERERTCPLHFL